MKITLAQFGKVLVVMALAGTAALGANAQVAQVGGSGGGSATITGTVGPGQTTEDTGFLQFNNLIVQSVSGSEIMATDQAFYPMPMVESAQGGVSASASTAVKTMGTCYRFNDQESARGTSIPCPVPPSAATVTPNSAGTGSASAGVAMPMMPTRLYRIEIDASTQLYLRDRTAASLSDFTANDQINVFGYYNADGSIQAYQVRDISKPVENQIFQLNNVLVSAISPDGTTLTVVQNGGPCYGFGANGAKQSIACPLGAMRTNVSVNGTTPSETTITPQFMTPAYFQRQYSVIIDSQTIILDSNRTRLQDSNLKSGDSLNVYGDTNDNGQTIHAEIIRDLSIPATASSYSGTVTQVNADGSFVIQTNDGQTITVKSPIQVGASVQVTGVLDRLQNLLSQVANILIGNNAGGGIKIVPTPMPMGAPGMLRTQGFPPPPSTSGTPNTKL